MYGRKSCPAADEKLAGRSGFIRSCVYHRHRIFAPRALSDHLCDFRLVFRRHGSAAWARLPMARQAHVGRLQRGVQPQECTDGLSQHDFLHASGHGHQRRRHGAMRLSAFPPGYAHARILYVPVCVHDVLQRRFNPHVSAGEFAGHGQHRVVAIDSGGHERV